MSIAAFRLPVQAPMKATGPAGMFHFSAKPQRLAIGGIAGDGFWGGSGWNDLMREGPNARLNFGGIGSGSGGGTGTGAGAGVSDSAFSRFDPSLLGGKSTTTTNGIAAPLISGPQTSGAAKVPTVSASESGIAIPDNGGPASQAYAPFDIVSSPSSRNVIPTVTAQEGDQLSQASYVPVNQGLGQISSPAVSPSGLSASDLTALSKLPSLAGLDGGINSPSTLDWLHAALNVAGFAVPPLGFASAAWNLANGISNGFDQKTTGSAPANSAPPSFTGNTFIDNLLSGNTSISGRLGSLVGSGLGWGANQFDSPQNTVQAPNIQPAALSAADIGKLSTLPPVDEWGNWNPAVAQSLGITKTDIANQPTQQAANQANSGSGTFSGSGSQSFGDQVNNNMGGADMFNMIGLNPSQTGDMGGAQGGTGYGSTWGPGVNDPITSGNSSGFGPGFGATDRAANPNDTNARGGGIKGYDDGGAIDLGGIAAVGQLQNPQTQASLQRFSNLPPEKLQELAVRLRGTPDGAVVQRVLQQKQMQAAQLPAQNLQPVAPTGGIAGVRNGGALRRELGGDISLGEGMPGWTRSEANSLMHGDSGFLAGRSMGRADAVSTTAPSGAYILPADVVAGLGEGNSLAGARVVDEMLRSGPWGTPKISQRRGPGPPRAPVARAPDPEMGQLAKGGAASAHMGKRVPVLLSHGEYQISVPDVLKIGRGDLKRGHRILDSWVLHERKQHINKLKNLPGPVRT